MDLFARLNARLRGMSHPIAGLLLWLTCFAALSAASMAGPRPGQATTATAAGQAGAQGVEGPTPSRTDSPEYPVLYTDRSETSTFNVEVMRGLALMEARGELYSINSYASSLLRFDAAQLDGASGGAVIAPLDVWPTLVDPVAVAVCDDDVYVLGQGTHALARHDSVTGEIVDLFAPGDFSEPADLVIDPVRREAYVSCMGSDCVVRIGLGAAGSGAPMEEIERWSTAIVGPTELSLKRPRFLAWTGEDLFVAPFLGGNNSMSFGTTPLPNQAGEHQWDASVLDGGTIYDAYEAASPVASDLPDVDLVRIRPGAPGQAVIEPTFRDAGSLLMGHGLDPVGGRYWMLGIDGMNVQYDGSGEPRLTEASLRGRFARNTLLAAPLPAPGAGPRTVTNEIRDLDSAPGSQASYHPDRSLPFPYALEFGGPKSLTAIASSTLSRVRLLGPAGQEVAMIPPGRGAVHDGETVRDLMFHGDDLLVYCQGSSNVLVWSVTDGVPAVRHRAELALLSDPTPEAISQGRSAFYDSHRSENWRLTCATCHPGGESDLLAWPLKEGVHDFKDQTVTQTLKGLRETFPYHWRGERDLPSFNAAFRDLLGAPRALSGLPAPDGSTELDDFQEFIFALRPAANPLEDLDRTPPDTALVPGMPGGAFASIARDGDVARGLDLYVNEAKICAQCHALPTGSVGSHHQDNTLTHERHVAWNRNQETIQLTNFLQARDQRMVKVTVPDPAPGSTGTIEIDRPLLGFGFQHTGAFTSLFHFMHARFAQILTAHIPGATPTDQVVAARDMAAFLRTLDTGTPPAAHRAVLLNADSPPDERRGIRRELVRQAQLGWIDLVVRSVLPAASGGGAGTPVSWLYSPVHGVFVPDLRGPQSPGAQPLGYFLAGAQVPGTRHLFMGILAGHGARLGIDFDRDGIVNGDEPMAYRWLRDRDGDGYPDGYEKDHGGTQDDPNGGPVDGTPPSLALDPGTGADAFEVLMARASHAELTFRATEEVRWELVATSLADPQAAVPPVESRGMSFARSHTIQVQGLRASEVSGVLSSYRIELTLIDRAGLRRSYDLGTDLTTSVDRGSPVHPSGGEERVVVNEISVSGESYDAGTATMRMDLRVEVGSFREIARPGAPGRVVIVQALRRGASNERWQRFDASEITHSGPNAANLALAELYGGSPYPAAPDGPFILMGQTGPDGAVTAQVALGGVGASDQVAISVVALPLAIHNASSTLADPSFPVETFSDWVMPATPPELRLSRVR